MDLFSQTVNNSFEFNTSSSGSTTAFGGFMLVWMLVIFIVSIVALWKVFEKAGEAGWKSIIPLLNAYIIVKIAGRPGWWLLLLLVPFVNFIVTIVLSIDIAKAFGKSTAFGVVGLWLFSLIGFLILGWGDATYTLPTESTTSEN